MADNSLFAEIAGESRALLRDVADSPDRAAGITAAAVLDDMLGMILDLHGEKCDGLVFHARIESCCRRGLISDKEQRDLHSIRSIRNTFAHTRHPVSFEDSGTKEKCRSLGFAQEFWAKAKGQPANTKVWFLSGWVLLANSLALRMRNSGGGEGPQRSDGNSPIVFGGGSAPE